MHTAVRYELYKVACVALRCAHLAILQICGEPCRVAAAAAAVRKEAGGGEPKKALLALPSKMVVIAALSVSGTMRLSEREEAHPKPTATAAASLWLFCCVDLVGLL